MKDLIELIAKLEAIKKTHGNLPIVHNDIELEVTGVSYKYLIIKSNYLVDKKKGKKEDEEQEFS